MPRKARIFEIRPFSSSFTIGVHDLDGLVRLDRARVNAAGNNAAQEVVGFKDRADHAERAVCNGWFRNVFEDQLEQRPEFFVLGTVRFGVHPAIAARAVKNREIKLFVACVHIGEQVKDLVDHFIGARIVAVNLVDSDNRLETNLEGLADHKLCLWHRAFGGINQKHCAIDHGKDTFHFAAEIGVAGRVNDIDTSTFPLNGGCLGEDRDTTLFFQIVGIHHAFFGALIVTEGGRLFQQFVNEGGLAMVNMGNDRNIAQGHCFGLVREEGAFGLFRPAPQNLAVPYRVFVKSERGPAWLFGLGVYGVEEDQPDGDP